MVKRLSTMWETRVRALGWEDSLEKEMAIHSSTIAWKIPWTEEPGRLQSMESQRVGHNLVTKRIRTGYNTRIKKNERYNPHLDSFSSLRLIKTKYLLECVVTFQPFFQVFNISVLPQKQRSEYGIGLQCPPPHE